MNEVSTGIGTRTTQRRESQVTTAKAADLSRDERQEWINSVDIATLDAPGLPNVPAREGMEQRWVRVKAGGEMDVKNLVAKEQRGWRPRSAQTASKAYQNLRIAEGDFAGNIGFHDVVLFERPIEIGEKVRLIEKQKVDDKELAIRSMQFRETEGYERDAGLVRYEKPELRSRVEVGTRVVDVPD